MANSSSKYGDRTLASLKEELKKRGAKTSGRKKDLVDRLEAYDRNHNFRDENDVPQDVYKLDLPDLKLYRDVIHHHQIPTISHESLDNYLGQFDKKLDEKARNLYEQQFLLCVRAVNLKGRFYSRARCCAEMKKSVVYNVDIIFDDHGIIQEAQCECGAGMGPDAHCKHVSCLLYALHCFSNGKELLLHKTCTEKLQTFHKCKRYRGSPLKASQLQLRQSCGKISLATFDPRPAKFRNMDGYNSYFRNVCINSQSITRMPILQLFPPANIKALCHDHDYFSQTPEDIFLVKNHLVHITESIQASLEQVTRGQSKTPDWFRIRSMRISSSRFGRVCKATHRTDFSKLCEEIISPKPIRSAAVNHGLKYESVAVKKYEQVNSVKTVECGTFVSLSHPYLCSTPDRLIGDSVVLEIKCPFGAKDKLITHQTVPYLKETEGELTLNRNHDYYYQVQGQLFCSGRKQCNLFVFTLRDCKSIVVNRDETFIKSMVQRLQMFYEDHLKESVLAKFLYRDFYKYTFDY